MEVTIRKSVPSDVYGIRDVQKLTWLKTYPNKEAGITIDDIRRKFELDGTPEGKKKIEDKKKRYRNKNTNMWVAEVNRRIVGFCSAIKEDNNNRIGSIYVLPAYQGKNIGKQLIKKAFDWLGNEKQILINVASYNTQAIGFYEKFGFIRTGKAGTLDSAAKLPSGKFIPEVELIK
jgi:ribosomal protein S18 acetylase RimI-like enzyme